MGLSCRWPLVAFSKSYIILCYYHQSCVLKLKIWKPGQVICGGFFEVEKKQLLIKANEEKMAETGFWDKPQEAQKLVADVAALKASIRPVIEFKRQINDLKALMELLEEASEEESESLLQEAQEMLTDLTTKADKLEIQSFLSEPYDHCNAILSIHAGAGGTESCDWAEMLLRMYIRWAERHGFQYEIQDLQAGDSAGLSSATIRIAGPYAYGYAKAGRGVHRLVRISPFDPNRRRHTSFSSVDVIAELEDEEIQVEIREEDLRIDTFRAGGRGGQHVNKTESAVRITHIPTGIVASCQSDRSQHKNKATALKNLKLKLMLLQQEEKKAEMEKFYGEKGEIGWGNQIMSYVFQPYQMVKDLRTGVETSNVQAVMDGDINLFITAWLRAGCPRSRRKDITDT